MKLFRKRYEAFSLVELAVAVGVFTILAGSVAMFSIDSVAHIENQRITVDANNQANQLLNAVVDFKKNDWTEFVTHTDGGQKHFDITGDTLSIANGSEVVNGMTRYFAVTSVQRDANEDIVDSGGINDIHTRKVTVYVSWTDAWGAPQSKSIGTYVNKWTVQRWRNDDEADFTLGTFNDTEIVQDPADSVGLLLQIALLPSWCNPALSATYFDIPGSGVARTVFADIEMAYLGTGGNSSGESFSKIEVSGLTGQDLSIEVLGTWDGEKVNYIFVDTEGWPDHAWMTTDNNQKEVDILSHAATPYSETGDVNMGGVVDGQAIYVANGIGYVGAGRNFSTFDASSITGTRPIRDTLSIGTSSAVISSIFVRGDYAYVGVESDTNEMFILDVSDEYNISEEGSISVNSVNTRDVFTTVDGNMTFLLTTQSASEDELYLIDVSTKNSPSVFDSMNVTSMSTTALAVVEEDKVFIVAGEHYTGENNYRVFEYDDVYEIVDCGGLEVVDDIHDISTTRLYDDDREQWNYYTYGVTDNASKEFQIVRGDEGEIGGGGFGYPPEGWFDSPAYDSDSATTNYHYFKWTETLVPETDIQIQMRVASTEAGLATATYVGPDGTAGTFYTNADYEEIHSSMDGNQWFQFQVYMTTNNRDVTPYLHGIDIVFEEE